MLVFISIFQYFYSSFIILFLFLVVVVVLQAIARAPIFSLLFKCLPYSSQTQTMHQYVYAMIWAKLIRFIAGKSIHSVMHFKMESQWSMPCKPCNVDEVSDLFPAALHLCLFASICFSNWHNIRAQLFYGWHGMTNLLCIGCNKFVQFFIIILNLHLPMLLQLHIYANLIKLNSVIRSQLNVICTIIWFFLLNCMSENIQTDIRFQRNWWNIWTLTFSFEVKWSFSLLSSIEKEGEEEIAKNSKNMKKEESTKWQEFHLKWNNINIKIPKIANRSTSNNNKIHIIKWSHRKSANVSRATPPNWTMDEKKFGFRTHFFYFVSIFHCDRNWIEIDAIGLKKEEEMDLNDFV